MKKGDKVISASLYQELQSKLKAEIERRKEAEVVVDHALSLFNGMWLSPPEGLDHLIMVENEKLQRLFSASSYRAKYPEGT